MKKHDARVLYSSKKTEMRTPRELFKLLTLKDGPFYMDAAASKSNALVPRFYTRRDNALTQAWVGIAYCNPPYGRGLDKWVKKAVEETMPDALLPVGAGCEKVVMLLPARTDRIFFHDLVWGYADEVRFLRGRLKFGGARDSAPFPSAIIIFKARTTTERTHPRVWFWDWRTEYSFRFESVQVFLPEPTPTEKTLDISAGV